MKTLEEVRIFCIDLASQRPWIFHGFRIMNHNFPFVIDTSYGHNVRVLFHTKHLTSISLKDIDRLLLLFSVWEECRNLEVTPSERDKIIINIFQMRVCNDDFIVYSDQMTELYPFGKWMLSVGLTLNDLETRNEMMQSLYPKKLSLDVQF